MRPSGRPLLRSAPQCSAHSLQGHPGLFPGPVLFLFLCSGARLCSDSGSLGGRLHAGKCHQICICFLLSPRGARKCSSPPGGTGAAACCGPGPLSDIRLSPLCLQEWLGAQAGQLPSACSGQVLSLQLGAAWLLALETVQALSLDLLQGQPHGRFRYNLGLKCFDQTTALKARVFLSAVHRRA